MKKYSKPQILVIPINTCQSVLTGSNPVGTNLYDTGFDSNSEALGREGYFLEDEEDE